MSKPSSELRATGHGLTAPGAARRARPTACRTFWPGRRASHQVQPNRHTTRPDWALSIRRRRGTETQSWFGSSIRILWACPPACGSGSTGCSGLFAAARDRDRVRSRDLGVTVDGELNRGGHVQRRWFPPPLRRRSSHHVDAAASGGRQHKAEVATPAFWPAVALGRGSSSLRWTVPDCRK